MEPCNPKSVIVLLVAPLLYYGKIGTSYSDCRGRPSGRILTGLGSVTWRGHCHARHADTASWGHASFTVLRPIIPLAVLKRIN